MSSNFLKMQTNVNQMKFCCFKKCLDFKWSIWNYLGTYLPDKVKKTAENMSATQRDLFQANRWQKK